VILVVADLSKLTLECIQLEEKSLFPSSCRHFQLSDFKSLSVILLYRVLEYAETTWDKRKTHNAYDITCNVKDAPFFDQDYTLHFNEGNTTSFLHDNKAMD
jgi:hypothetical protein